MPKLKFNFKRNDSGSNTVSEKIPQVPETRYFKEKDKFDEAVGEDFIHYANQYTKDSDRFLVGLAHGESPSGVYEYILNNFHKIQRPELIRFTFTNTRLIRQRNLEGVFEAATFLTRLLRNGMIDKDQILGRSLNREDIEEYAQGFNQKLKDYLMVHDKTGYDYVFLAFDQKGRVAGVSRNNTAIFESEELVEIVDAYGEKEISGTPHFLMQAKRIVFLATKVNKRRPLAMLYHKNAKKNESPSFLRFIPDVENRICVFVDDQSLTWPQIRIERETEYGVSVIKMDMAKPYDPETQANQPVILFLHGFLGLNSFDGLLTQLSEHDYIGAAMHYGTIPHDLPYKEYSKHVLHNIDAAVGYFGEKGHPVYIFDHSMGNTYFLLLDRDLDQLHHVRKYLRGRIGANPFFCKHAKHAFIGFLDNVLLPAASFRINSTEKALLLTLRRLVPLDSKKGVIKRGMNLTEWLIKKDSQSRDRLWKAAKGQVVNLMTRLDSVPHLDRIPIEKALSSLPSKIFAIQVHAALHESYSHVKQRSLPNIEALGIPILIIKSERDAVAKFDDYLLRTDNVTIIDVTNPSEKDLFREHLFHMATPGKAYDILIEFVQKVEQRQLIKI